MRIIGGEWGGRTIRAPTGRDVRPTADRVREAWMSILGDRLVEARVVDLFAGSGALGLEALSRGAREAVFVDRNRTALQALRRNIETLGAADRCTVVPVDVFRFLDSLDGDAFELALADPPYGQGLAARLFSTNAHEPFARSLWVEHGTGEGMPPLTGLLQRRYGDTTLSIWELDV